ncbi:pyridoxamine 5'-phosphate oxidase family protein [Chryseolinea sp. H1M3-3]|uniref:pyridoxamine 5'-phosphate oxidase family protein n=1 Tax=Chryseolinea sp. H1M3-3 TaxID=3034144 RepID=UPI0023EB1108|nr:pyridoxamine 5'-phosphate oxidase family protein [Chryseolinea sp. H1M3-3]
MLGVLTPDQCKHVLKSELIGRIGCYAAGRIYVVPITYVYMDNYIYAHSQEGLKVRMMRKNPKICFEVESRDSMRNWRSVIIWGKYEELKTLTEQKKAMKILNDRLLPFTLSESLKTRENMEPPYRVEKERKPVVYRISVDEVTGRFENSRV